MFHHHRQDKLRDHFWAWGHSPGAHNNYVDYNLPGKSTIDPFDGATFLGLSNLMMVRFGTDPSPPYDALAGSLKGMKQVVWSLVGAGGSTDRQDRQSVMRLCDVMPNLTGFIFDDFWNHGPESNRGMVMSSRELEEIEHFSRSRNLNLWSVLYVGELYRPEISHFLPIFTHHTLWCWESHFLKTIEDKLRRFKELIPDSPRYMGVYLWDYGKKQPMPMDLLQHQCEVGKEWIRSGDLDGLIFLATCICDLEIDAVKWAREWIASVGDLPWRPK